MPDVYATIETADEAVQERLADVLEMRAADPQQRGMLGTYLDDLALPGGSRVLDLGCGTGAVARTLAGRPEVCEVVGVDPSSVFIERGRRLSEAIENLSLQVGDAREVALPDGSFSAVVLHTVLCHIPGPERVLGEAFRLVGPGGRLAIFDGDYARPRCLCTTATRCRHVRMRRLRRWSSTLGWLAGCAAWSARPVGG
jgi:ubiquinone/menaquinone biosynthesis C-methylase UbiE